MPRVVIRKKFEDIDFEPVCACLDLEGDHKTWGLDIPVEQGKDMEKDGFCIGWVRSIHPFELARHHVTALHKILNPAE